MNQSFRPQIQNGPIARRPQPTYTVRTAQAAPRASKLLSQVSPIWEAPAVGDITQRGLSLFGLDRELRSTKTAAAEKATTRSYALLGLIVCGAVLAGGFMFSLRDHFIARAFGHEEVKLKTKMDQAASEKNRLAADLNHVASPAELERTARETSELAPLVFDQKKAVIGTKKITAAEKAKPATTPRAR